MTMDNSAISQLLVAHRLRDAAGHGMPESQAALFREQGFFLGTCLRELAIMTGSADLAPQLHRDSQLEWHWGQSAYSFLLQTATGLNSSVPGETNILGQFRFAWHDWRQQTSPGSFYRLQAVMQRLFADSKRVRRDYLQGIGGNSYGSLVRKLLMPERSERILLVGTGKLARSMTAFFDNCEVAAWNHKTTRQPSATTRLFAADEAAEAARWATRVVITSPADEVNDRLWFGLTAGRKDVVHLGRRRGEPGVWADWPGPANFFDLDSVFDLRKRQSSLRSLQILRARNACEVIARQSEVESYFPVLPARRIYA